MRYTVLNKTGLKISVIGLGFWQVGSILWRGRNITINRVREIISKAYDIGINFYDTAEIYGWGKSEELLGTAIRNLGIRDDVVITSKIAGFRHRYNDMLKAAKNIVKRLGSVPDIILHHWPPPFYANICRIVQNLEKIIDKGLSHYYGLSNYGEDLLEKVLTCARKYDPVLNQLHYNLGYRVLENRLEHIMKREKMAIVAWSPLAKGALAGLEKPRTIIQKTDKVFKTIISDKSLQEKLWELSKKYGVKQSVIALSWIIAHGIIPIPGTSKPYRVEDYGLAGKIVLDQKDVFELDRITEKYKYYWGTKYSALRRQRYIPGFLQKLGIWLMRGI